MTEWDSVSGRLTHTTLQAEWRALKEGFPLRNPSFFKAYSVSRAYITIIVQLVHVEIVSWWIS